MPIELVNRLQRGVSSANKATSATHGSRLHGVPTRDLFGKKRCTGGSKATAEPNVYCRKTKYIDSESP